MTLGVRAVVFDAQSKSVLLVRHTYLPGLHLPGGGVEAGETIAEALAREVEEEANVRLVGVPVLKSLHTNRQVSRRDHVALYLVMEFEDLGPMIPNHEIAEAGFFPLGALPEGVTAATRRRLAEVFDGGATDAYW